MPNDTQDPGKSQAAATDVEEFISDLDGGQFSRMLSVALSKSAAAAVDRQKKAKVVIEFELAPIAGSHMVHVGHSLTFAAAVRNITIEAAKKVTSSEQQLGAERSAFESVQASSGDNLPTTIDFLCEPPYFGLAARTLRVRLSVLATDKPALVLRVVKLEEHQECMAAEFAQLVHGALDGELPVAIGSYARGG